MTIKGFDKKYRNADVPVYFYSHSEWDYSSYGYKQVWEARILDQPIQIIPSDNSRDKHLYILEPSKSEPDSFVTKPFDKRELRHWLALLNDFSKRVYDQEEKTPFDFLFYAIRFYLSEEKLAEALKYGNDVARTNFHNSFCYFGCCLPMYIQEKMQSILGRYGLAYEPKCLPFLDNAYLDIFKDRIALRNLDIFQKADAIESADSLKEADPLQQLMVWRRSASAVMPSYKPLLDYFCFFSRKLQNNLLRRYFLDVKLGKTALSLDLLDNLANNQYKHFDILRQCLRNDVPQRDISIELVCDCVRTFFKNNGEKLQDINGIVDTSLLQCDHSNPKVNFESFEDEWLCRCTGGVILNNQFKGFVDIRVQYEIDPSKMQEKHLKSALDDLLGQCERQFREEIVVREDILTEEGKPKEVRVRKYLDIWRVYDNRTVKKLNLFLREQKASLLEIDYSKPENRKIPRPYYELTPECFDLSVVGGRVGKYLEEKDTFNYRTGQFYLTKVFLKPARMFFTLNEKARIGYNFGIDSKNVIRNILDNFKELSKDAKGIYSASYDDILLRNVMFYTFYNRSSSFSPTEDSDSDNLFVLDCNKDSNNGYRYRNRRASYLICRPKMNEEVNPIIGAPTLWCQGETCFHSCLIDRTKDNADWENYRLLDILKISGFPVFASSTTGIVPCEAYGQFVTQLRRAKKLWERLKCVECGHVLFPTGQNSGMGIYNYFTCKNPNYCSERGKSIYLSYCYHCKTGIIDDRVGARCPNGSVICPTCLHCCSDLTFEHAAQRYIKANRQIPARIQEVMGHGHQGHKSRSSEKFFCPDCGNELEMINVPDRPDISGFYCRNCNKRFNDNDN